MTDADRKARERQRKKAAGLVRIEEWVPAERVKELRQIAERMRKEMDDELQLRREARRHPKRD